MPLPTLPFVVDFYTDLDPSSLCYRCKTAWGAPIACRCIRGGDLAATWRVSDTDPPVVLDLTGLTGMLRVFDEPGGTLLWQIDANNWLTLDEPNGTITVAVPAAAVLANGLGPKAYWYNLTLADAQDTVVVSQGTFTVGMGCFV